MTLPVVHTECRKLRWTKDFKRSALEDKDSGQEEH